MEKFRNKLEYFHFFYKKYKLFLLILRVRERYRKKKMLTEVQGHYSIGNMITVTNAYLITILEHRQSLMYHFIHI